MWDTPLGSSSSAYYNSFSLYQRDFSNGKVIVNPTDSGTTYSLSLSSKYKDLDGNIISSVSLSPKTGTVLVKYIDPTPTPTTSPVSLNPSNPNTSSLTFGLGIPSIPKNTPITIMPNKTEDISKLDKLTPNVFKDKGGIAISYDKKASIVFSKETASKDFYVTITKIPQDNSKQLTNNNKKTNYNNPKDHTTLSDIYQIKTYGMDKKEVTSNLTQKDKYATLSFKYSSNNQIKPNSQNVYYYRDNQWKNKDLISQIINQDKLLVTVKTNHLTDYAILGANISTTTKILNTLKSNTLVIIVSLLLISGLVTLLVIYIRKRKVNPIDVLTNV